MPSRRPSARPGSHSTATKVTTVSHLVTNLVENHLLHASLAFIAAKHKHKQEVREAEAEGLAPPPMPDHRMVAIAASGYQAAGCLLALRYPVPSRLLAACPQRALRGVVPCSVVWHGPARSPLWHSRHVSISVLCCGSAQSCLLAVRPAFLITDNTWQFITVNCKTGSSKLSVWYIAPLLQARRVQWRHAEAAKKLADDKKKQKKPAAANGAAPRAEKEYRAPAAYALDPEQKANIAGRILDKEGERDAAAGSRPCDSARRCSCGAPEASG